MHAKVHVPVAQSDFNDGKTDGKERGCMKSNMRTALIHPLVRAIPAFILGSLSTWSHRCHHAFLHLLYFCHPALLAAGSCTLLFLANSGLDFAVHENRSNASSPCMWTYLQVALPL